MDTIGVERVHLIAHDFGGAWATAWAAQHRDQVASVTLIDAPVVPSFRWHPFARVWQTPLLGEIFQTLSTRAMIKAVMRRDNPRPLPRHFVDRVAQHADIAQKLRVLRIYRDAGDPANAFSSTANTLKQIDPPACIIWGDSDPYADVLFAHDTRALFSSARLHVIERAGHWPFIDDPQTVAAALRDFLSAHSHH